MSDFAHVRRVRWHMDWAWILKSARFRPRTFCECGVGPLEISAAAEVYRLGLADKFTLIEPNPQLADAAQAAMPYADVHRFAIGLDPAPGATMTLRLNGGSSYLDGTWAPTPSDGQTVVVDVRPFTAVDTGSIDALVLDCEGQEYSVLRRMRSRPRYLSVEIWRSHPEAEDIFQWLANNDYRPLFSTGPEGETILCERA